MNSVPDQILATAKVGLINTMRELLHNFGSPTQRVASGTDPRLGWRVSKKHWLTEKGRLVTVKTTWTDHRDEGHDYIDEQGVRHLAMVKTAERVAETTDLSTVTVDDLSKMISDIVDAAFAKVI